MVHKPKRRKYKDNPYVIERINGVNFISFIDSNNRLQVVEVNTKVFEVFDESELHDLSQMHKDEAHIDFRSIDNTEKMDNILFQYDTQGIHFLQILAYHQQTIFLLNYANTKISNFLYI